MDCWPDGDLMCLWLRDSAQRNVFAVAAFSPPLYVQAAPQALLGLSRQLRRHGIACRFAAKPSLEGTRFVLECRPPLSGFSALARQLDARGFTLYNADIPPEDYFLFAHDLYPTAQIRAAVRDGIVEALEGTRDNPLEYGLPPLRVAEIEFESAADIARDSSAPIRRIALNGEWIGEPDATGGGPAPHPLHPPRGLCGFAEEVAAVRGRGVAPSGGGPAPVADLPTGQNEARILQAFYERYRHFDSDVVLCQDGHLGLAYLRSRLAAHFPGALLGRFGPETFEPRPGKSYFAYGRTVFKRPPAFLRGRWHFREGGLIYGDWSLHSTIELARACRATAQRINHRSAGFGITNLQLYTAYRRGWLLPHKENLVERFKSVRLHHAADRGGLIYTPRLGLHTDIAEVDFVSLYPNIMVKHNISPETMFPRPTL